VPYSSPSTDLPINEPGCAQGGNRIEIAASNPNIKQWIAIALAAKASGMNIYGAVSGCDPTTGNPTLDSTYSRFMCAY